MTTEPLKTAALHKLAAIAAPGSKAFVIGGQALGLWAAYYAVTPPEVPETYLWFSVDMDFYGTREDAERLKELVGGRIKAPGVDDHTPQTAVLNTVIDGDSVHVDFLADIAGVEISVVKASVIPLVLPTSSGEVPIQVMHPIDVLMSRVANVAVLGRSSAHDIRQIEIASIVVSRFIYDALRNAKPKAVSAMARRLIDWLEKDIHGRKAHLLGGADPLDILTKLARSTRIDSRYRDKTLKPAIARIRKKRASFEKRMEAAQQKRTR